MPSYKHGDGYESKLYNKWRAIRRRCYDENYVSYKNYGARGIQVCEEWRNSYINFKTWAIKNGYKDGLEIDRKKNDDHYSPNNCRFITRYQNSLNKRKRTNKSKYKGVRPTKNGKWQARIKQYCLGTFESEKLAAIEYNKKATELFGEFASLNKVENETN